MNDIRISRRQFGILVIVFTIGTTILFIPSILTAASKQDAWLASLLAAGIGAMLAWFYSGVGQSLPGEAPAAACERILGAWLGRAAALWYALFCLLLTALVLRNMGDFIATAILPETPIQMVHLLFLAAVVIAVRAGPETIARTAEIFFPWILLFVAVLVFLLLPKSELQHALPVAETGLRSLLRGAYSIVGTPYLELVVLLSLYPYMAAESGRTAGFVTGAVVGGLVLTAVVALSVTVLGPDLTAKQTYPSYVLARKISVGRFLERLESVMAGLWFLTVFFKTAICYYAASLSFAQLFKLSDYKSVTLPLAVIIMVLSIVVYPNTSYSLRIITDVWTMYALTAGLLLPGLLWLTASLRRRKPDGQRDRQHPPV